MNSASTRTFNPDNLKPKTGHPNYSGTIMVNLDENLTTAGLARIPEVAPSNATIVAACIDGDERKRLTITYAVPADDAKDPGPTARGIGMLGI